MPIVCVSGFFNPIHWAHVKHMEEAAKYGDLIVILNSDEASIKKSGFSFMPWNERKYLIEKYPFVKQVVSVNDTDGTVCEALRRIRPDFYAKGGDRTASNTPELELCESLGITPVFGVGGTDKPQSSSWLVKNAMEALNKGSKLVYPDGV